MRNGTRQHTGVHTPGPWTCRQTGYAGRSSSAYYIEARNTGDHRSPAVAHIKRSTVQPMLANGRLIAAAPDMLATLLFYRDECSGAEPSLSAFHQKLDAAVAKATTGKSA